MKILILYPNLKGQYTAALAISMLNRIIQERGHQVKLFDSSLYECSEEGFVNSDEIKIKNLNVRPFDPTLMHLADQKEDAHRAFVAMVESFSPDLIAMSCTEDTFELGISLLAQVRRHNILTIVGGVFATFAPEKAILYPEIQLVCVGEGEEVFANLLTCLEQGQSFDRLAGLWIKKSNGTVIRNLRGEAVDLNASVIQDPSIFPEAKFYKPMEGRVWRMMPVESQRGCPFKCTYCNSPSQVNTYWDETGTRYTRKKTVQRLHQEISLLHHKFKAESIFFTTDTFLALSNEEIDEFCEMYSEFKLPFWFNTRTETVTYDRFKKLKDVGLMRCAFGIEHGNEEFRRVHIKRNVKNEDIVRKLKILNDLEVNFSVNNILGFPYETRELALDTIELNRQIHSDDANAYAFSPFHGTPLRDDAIKEGWLDPRHLVRSISARSLLKMPQFTAEEIEGIRRCFILYIRMPKHRFADIKRAEALTPEGDRIWEELKAEYNGVYRGRNQDGSPMASAGMTV